MPCIASPIIMVERTNPLVILRLLLLLLCSLKLPTRARPSITISKCRKQRERDSTCHDWSHHGSGEVDLSVQRKPGMCSSWWCSSTVTSGSTTRCSNCLCCIPKTPDCSSSAASPPSISSLLHNCGKIAKPSSNKAFSIFFDPSKLEALTPDKVQNRPIFNPLPLLCTRRSTFITTWRNKENGTFLSTAGIGKKGVLTSQMSAAFAGEPRRQNGRLKGERGERRNAENTTRFWRHRHRSAAIAKEHLSKSRIEPATIWEASVSLIPYLAYLQIRPVWIIKSYKQNSYKFRKIFWWIVQTNRGFFFNEKIWQILGKFCTKILAELELNLINVHLVVQRSAQWILIFVCNKF